MIMFNVLLLYFFITFSTQFLGLLKRVIQLILLQFKYKNLFYKKTGNIEKMIYFNAFLFV